MADDFREKNYGVTPQTVSDLDVWRAAKQMIDLYPEAAETAAVKRAGLALDQGDLFNFNLWRRVAKAAYQLQRQKPAGGEALN